MLTTFRQSLLAGILHGTLLPGWVLADAAQDQYAVGAAHYAQQRWDLAAEELAEFLARFPQHARANGAHFYRGNALAQLRQFAEARRHFRTVLDQTPEGPLAKQSLFRSGEAAYLRGDTAAAQADFDQFREKYPNDNELGAYLLPYLGDLALRAGDSVTAERTYRLALERFPRGPLKNDCHFGLALAVEQQGRTGAALSAYRDLANQTGNGLAAKSRVREGLLLYRNGNYADALRAAMRVHAGNSFLLVGDHDQALRQFDRGLADFPDSPWADDCLLGRLRVALDTSQIGVVDQGIADFRRRFPDSPLQQQVELVRTSVLIARGSFADAIAPLKSYLRSGTDDGQLAKCCADLAVCHARLGQFEAAQETYARLQERHPHHELVLPTTRQLAEAAFAGGNFVWSDTLFEHLTETADDPALVASGLSGRAWSQLKAGKPRRSADTFGRLLQRYPNDPRAPEAALVRGRILQQLHNLDDALESYQLVLRNYPDCRQLPAALLGAAEVHQYKQEPQQAQALYERVIRQHPDFEHVDTAIYALAWVLRDTNQTLQANLQFMRLYADYRQSPHWAEATYAAAESARNAANESLAERLLVDLINTEEGRIGLPSEVLDRALYLRGRMAADRKAWDAVVKPMTQITEQFPDSSLQLSAAFWIAEAAYRRGMLQEAETRFGALVRMAQLRQESWLAMIPLRRARVLAQRQQWSKALEIASSIESEFPAFERQYEASYLIGRCHASLGALALARASYAKVILAPKADKTETAAMAQWMIGETYMHQQDFHRALREFLRTEILYAYPEWQARALLEAAKCYELQGQHGQAAKLYTRLLKKYSDTSSAHEASARLPVARGGPQRGQTNKR